MTTRDRRRQVKRTRVNNGDSEPPSLPPKRVSKPKSSPKHNGAGKDERVGEELLKHVILTPDEVALLLRIDVSLVMSLSHDGYLPGLRMGNEIRFLRRDVLIYLRTLRKKTVGAAEPDLMHSFLHER